MNDKILYTCQQTVSKMDSDRTDRRVVLNDDGTMLEDTGAVSKLPQFITTFIACLAATSAGMALGYTAQALDKIENDGKLNEDQSTWFGSLISVGAMVGGPIAGSFIDLLGRKFTIMTCAIPFVVGWLIIAAVNNYIALYMGRILTGIGLGMATLSVPLYIAETSSKDMRGMLGSGGQLGIVIGVLMGFSLGIPLSWRWLAVASAVVPAVLVISMLFIPETPRWLISKCQRVEAANALQHLRGSRANIEEELAEIEYNLNASDSGLSCSYLKQRSVRIPLLVAFGLMMEQQLGGINAVIFYTNDIFQSAGFSGNSSLPTLIIAVVQVLATVVACALIDRAGRRILLIISGTVMTLSMFTLGLYYYLSEHKHVEGIGWVSLTSLIIYVAAFSLGWGPIPWLMMAELFPLRVRGPACSACTMLNWTCSFIVTKEFSDMQKEEQKYGAFWTFGAICLIGVIFVILCVPETKGKTLEEIEEYYEGQGHNSDVQEQFLT